MNRVAIIAFLLLGTCSSVFSRGKWNGLGPHPDDILAYLKSRETGGCSMLFYQSRKIKHSPGVRDIPFAYCVINRVAGAGISKTPVCEVLRIDWNRGNAAFFYDGRYRLFKKGPCGRKTMDQLMPEISRIMKALKFGNDEKVHVLKDSLNYKKRFYQKLK